MKLEFHPVTADRWSDFETLFGKNGACAGCWCMWWRITRAEFERRAGAANRRAMRRIIGSGEVPGILAYHDGVPVGWCSVAPRESFPVLARSPVLKPIDDEPVWSIVCFFIRRDYRRRGVTVALIRAAVAYARARGARLVEGYPKDALGGDGGTPRKQVDAASVFTGLVSAFRRAGFTECARRSRTRPIMRYAIRRRGPKSNA